MSNQNNGGPAFPTEQGHIPDGTWNQTYDPGMTLRDYFAAKAMQGMINDSPFRFVDLAKEAYSMADAMLKERDK